MVHNKQGTKRSLIVRSEVQIQSRIKEKKKKNDTEMAELVVYLIEMKEPFLRHSYLQ